MELHSEILRIYILESYELLTRNIEEFHSGILRNYIMRPFEITEKDNKNIRHRHRKYNV